MMPIIGGLGVILAVTGLGCFLFLPAAGWVVTLCETASLFCLTAYFVANWQTFKTFSTRRSTRVGFQSIVGVMLILGILLIVNFLAHRHGARWDLSESQRFSLAPQTYRVLGELQKPVRITVFSHQRSPGFGAYRDLLDAYSHASPHIAVEFVDPEQSPHRAKEYKITRLDSAVFESGSQTIHVTRPTEVELTGALLRVTRETKKRIGFLTGHGERGIDNRDRGGFSMVHEALGRQGYKIENISLNDTNAISRDVATLVVAGPQGPLASQEFAPLRDFIRSGGRLLLLLDPQTSHGYAPLLQEWGLELLPGIIVDLLDRIAQGSPTALQIRTFTDHDITHNITAPVLLPVSQGIGFSSSLETPWQFTPLAHTSEKSWAELTLGKTTPSLDPDIDIPGPMTVAAVLESDATNTPIRHSAIVVIGNSAFASNAYLHFPGNIDFFLQTIAWLAGEQQLLSISPKDPALRPFIPNPTQEHLLLAIQVFSLPFLLLMAGLMIWRRRVRL